MRIAFLCSGNGGNLRFIWHAIESGMLPAVLCGVFADRECGAAEFARARGVPTVVAEYSPDRPSAMVDILDEFSPDLVISTIHRLIAPEVVQGYSGRIINLHYSQLPDFGGAGMIGEKPVRLAIERGDRRIGTTVHFVDETFDTGKIVSQNLIPVIDGEPFKETMDRVFQAGCVNLLGAILMVGGIIDWGKARG